MIEFKATRSGWSAGKIVLTFLVFPLFLCGLTICLWPLDGKSSAKNTACISNMKQLGTATLMYSADFDDAPPIGDVPNGPYCADALGWGGRIFSYLGNEHWPASKFLFRCPFSPAYRSEKEGGGPFTVNYAMNGNLAAKGTKLDLQNAKTVLFFEVEGGMAYLNQPDEGLSGGAQYLQMSPVGSGVIGDLYGHRGPGTDTGLRYRTGVLSNSDFSHLDNTEELRRPWHNGKTHIAAMDSHVKTIEPNLVSAGRTAQSSFAGQVSTGCGEGGEWPCAAGAGDAKHTFTFSAK